MHVERNVWNGKVGECKTRKSRAAIPVIRQLAERLELHRPRSGNPQTGPIFRNSAGKPLSLGSVVDRSSWPALNVCAVCRKKERDHLGADHRYQRDESIPQWQGWHAARRGLGSNLYGLGVLDKAIQRILRHANVSTTLGYYVKAQPQDARDAMTKLEKAVPENPALTDTHRTLSGNSAKGPASIQ